MRVRAKLKEKRNRIRYFYLALLVTHTKMTTKELIRYSTEELKQMYEGLQLESMEK